MKFKDLKRGDIINPSPRWQWPKGLHVVDAVHDDVAHVILWASDSGVGNLYKSSWRSHMYGGSLDSNDLKLFTEFVEETFTQG